MRGMCVDESQGQKETYRQRERVGCEKRGRRGKKKQRQSSSLCWLSLSLMSLTSSRSFGRQDCHTNQSPSHLHLRICRVCSAPLPNQTSCPLTSFRGRVTLFLARTALLIGSFSDDADAAAAAAAATADCLEDDLDPFKRGRDADGDEEAEDEDAFCCCCCC